VLIGRVRGVRRVVGVVGLCGGDGVEGWEVWCRLGVDRRWLGWWFGRRFASALRRHCVLL
jgi:hypothetical protein